jgi:hypothetical protein
MSGRFMQGDFNPGVAAPAFQPRRHHLGVVDHHHVAGGEQLGQVDHVMIRQTLFWRAFLADL